MARTSTNTADASFNFGTANVLGGATSALWSCWIKVDAWNQAFQFPWTKDDYPTQAAGWGFQRNNTADAFLFFTRGGGASQTFTMTAGATAGAGWVHYAAYWSATQVQTFRAGVGSSVIAPGAGNPLGSNAITNLVSVPDKNVSLADLAVWRNPPFAASGAGAFVAPLALGACPLTLGLRPIFYAPLVGRGSAEPDLTGTLRPAAVPQNSGSAADPASFLPNRLSAVAPAAPPTSGLPRVRRDRAAWLLVAAASAARFRRVGLDGGVPTYTGGVF